MAKKIIEGEQPKVADKTGSQGETRKEQTQEKKSAQIVTSEGNTCHGSAVLKGIRRYLHYGGRNNHATQILATFQCFLAHYLQMRRQVQGAQLLGEDVVKIFQSSIGRIRQIHISGHIYDT